MKGQVSIEYLFLFGILAFTTSIILGYLMKSNDFFSVGLDKASGIRESSYYSGVLSAYLLNYGFASAVKLEGNATLMCRNDKCYVIKGSAVVPLSLPSSKVKGNFV